MKKEVKYNIKGEEWNKAKDKAFNELNKTNKVDGFRKGKVPRNVFEKKLKPYYFFRCHKSYIINLKKVTRIEKNNAFIGNILIPVSKYKLKEFKNLLAKTLGDIL